MDYCSGNGPFILLNRGDGTFTSPGTRVPIQYGVGVLLVGDVNGDRKVDLIATNVSTVFVLLGNGNGTFANGPTYTVLQGGQEDTVLRDFNRDGKLDVAVLLRSGVQMLLGNGNRTFTSGPTSTVGSFAMSGSTMANSNNDEIPDLYASDEGAQLVYALKGDGSGGFTQTGSGTTGNVPGTILAGDLNHDGYDDAVALNEFNQPGTAMAVLLNKRQGGFAAARYYEGGFNPANEWIADLNGDGNLDVISSDTTGNADVVIQGNASGGFSLAGRFRWQPRRRRPWSRTSTAMANPTSRPPVSPIRAPAPRSCPSCATSPTERSAEGT